MAAKGPEHEEVRLPLIDKLVALGWHKDQILWDPEWKVPKTPSDATKREEGKSFAGFPVDIALFETPERRGDREYVKVLIETKAPDIEAGISQLETYMSLEPRVRLGIWTNGSKNAALIRLPNGTFQQKKNVQLPQPDDDLIEGGKPLCWPDLTPATAKDLTKAFERLLNFVVIGDSRSTRPDDRLNQLCNLILVKLESDRKGKMAPTKPVVFQVWKDEAQTAKKVRDLYDTMRLTHADIFGRKEDSELHLDDATIHQACYELAAVKLIDVGLEAVSRAFQVFRNETLKSEEGQYFTPTPVIRSAVKLLDIQYDDKIIDPACGTGGFLLECFRQLRENNAGISEGDAKAWAQRHLYGVDKDPISVKLTKAMMIVLGDGSTHTQVGDSLRRHQWAKKYPALVPMLTDESFTVIVTNPPFGEKLTLSAADARDAGLTICQKPKKVGEHYTFEKNKYVEREVGLAFLELCYRLLVVGGRMAIVLPETYLFSKSYLWLYDWLEPRLALRGIFNVPMEAFQGFCRAKTNLYVFEKKAPVEKKA